MFYNIYSSDDLIVIINTDR